MPIICLSGPDGSGKSTLVGMLAEKLQKEEKVRISWMRGSHTLASVLADFLSKFSSFKGRNNPYYEIKIPKKMRRLWQIIEFLSAIPIVLSRFLLPSLFGCTVICDRYVPDFVVWVSLTTGDEKYPHKPEARFLLKLSTMCDYKAYIYASRETLRKRSEDEDTGLGTEQIEFYGSVAKSIGAEWVDTTEDSPEESFRKILGEIKRETN